MAYTSRDSWEKMTSGTGWTFDNFPGFPGQLVISQGLVPNGRPQDVAACAQSNLYRPAGRSCARQNTRAGAIYRDLWGT